MLYFQCNTFVHCGMVSYACALLCNCPEFIFTSVRLCTLGGIFELYCDMKISLLLRQHKLAYALYPVSLGFNDPNLAPMNASAPINIIDTVKASTHCL